MGVSFLGTTAPKQNIEISGNNFSIQNRIVDGAGYGIFIGQGPTTNLTISNNTITFDTSGRGFLQFWGIAASLLNNATISNNTIGTATFSYNAATGSGVTLLNNRHPDGTLVPGL